MLNRTSLAGLGTLLWTVSLAGQRANVQATYTLKPTPKTVAWGHYDEGFWGALK